MNPATPEPFPCVPTCTHRACAEVRYANLVMRNEILDMKAIAVQNENATNGGRPTAPRNPGGDTLGFLFFYGTKEPT